MINRFQLIRNIGQFESVNGVAAVGLSRLTLIYAENGRGKTTLAAILRSVGTNDPFPISERSRLGTANTPHVVLDCEGGPPVAIFQGNAWNRALSNISIFDDQFVDQNVYSGLVVESGHRQKLHELILGSQGVTLNRRLQDIVNQIEVHNTELRTRANSISISDRGTYSVDDFCILPAHTDIEAAIQAAQRSLSAAREQEPIRTSPIFDVLSLPAFDIPGIEATLRQDLPALDATAAALVQSHLARIGGGGEAWIADGMVRVPPEAGQVCPFCAQELADSPVIGHYRAYFSEAYSQLKVSIAAANTLNTRTHGGDVPAAFERALRIAVERRQFWTRFCEVPEISIDTAGIVRDWRAAFEAVAAILTAKQAAPLEMMELSERSARLIEVFNEHRAIITELNEQLRLANATILTVKEHAAVANVAALASDVARLTAIKRKHLPAVAAQCQSYLEEKAAKAATEVLRDQARAALDQYRTNVFPSYQTAINQYLQRFNAGFRLGSMTSANTRGGSTCTYSVVINGTDVPVAGGTITPGTPSFRSTLSAGDRNTLALAFFFASLDQDAAIGSKIVVIDDPMTSLDEHRSLATVQEVRGLSQRVQQVIALSHSKTFLCGIWQYANRQTCATLSVVQSTTGSTIAAWAIGDDAISEYDKQHARLRNYQPGNAVQSRVVAQDLRHVLEGFLRRCCPAHFLPGEVLGDLRRKIRDQAPGVPAILTPLAVTELDLICEYANRFHHTTNAAWETEAINEVELQGWVRRVLAFVSK